MKSRNVSLAIAIILLNFFVLSAFVNVYATDEDFYSAVGVGIKLPNDEQIHGLFSSANSKVNKSTGEVFVSTGVIDEILNITTLGYTLSYFDESTTEITHTMEIAIKGYYCSPSTNNRTWYLYSKNNPTKRYEYSLDGTDERARDFNIIGENIKMLRIKDVLDFFDVPYEKIEFDRDTNMIVISLLSSDNLKIVTDPKYIDIAINGSRFTLAPSEKIIEKNNRLLVPMRAFFEELGATVEWEDATKSITATKDDTIVKLTIDSKTAYVNGNSLDLDVEAQLVGNGKTYVPLRFIAEALKCTVDWDSAKQLVKIIDNSRDNIVDEDVMMNLFYEEVIAKIQNTVEITGYGVYPAMSENIDVADAYSFRFFVNKDGYNNFFADNVNDLTIRNKVKVYVENMYKKINKIYPNARVDGMIIVDDYNIFALSWDNYDTLSEKISEEKVRDFEWFLDGNSYGDSEEVVRQIDG